MAYPPPPPPPGPMKRPYQGDWAPPRPAKEPRPPGTDDFSRGPGSQWGSGYSEYGYYGWGNPDYTENFSSDGYRGNMQSNNINVDFTDDYSAFYGKDSNSNRGNGNQRGNNRGNFAGGQFQKTQGGVQNRGQGHLNRGQFNQNRGQGNQNRGQGNQNRGQGNQNRGQGNQNRGQGNQNRGGRGVNRGGQRGQFRGRGMPPNMFSNPRGRGKGGNKAAVLAVVPPVHSLASAKPDILDIQNMSLAEKLHRFCLYLKNDDSIKINAIQTIMNAITSSKLGLKATYESEELAKVAGKAMYTGVLKLDTVFLARAIRPNKKELKQEVFQKALNVMLSMTVAEIYNLVDPGADAIREELDRQMKAEETLKLDIDDTIKECESAEAKSLVGGDIQTILSQLISTIKNMKSIPDSPISIIEQASTQAHILIKHEYNVDVIRMKNGRLYCKGRLSIGHVVIGRGGAVTKKKCKTETYEKTLERLKTLSIEELMESVPEEEVPDTWMANKSKVHLTLEERFAELIRSLGSMSFKESNINQIDVAAMQNGIVPMVIFKLDKEKKEHNNSIICELYLEKVFITSTEGTSRRDCMVKVYNMGWEILTSTDVDTLITQHRQITDEEIKDPTLLDVLIKGSGRTVESNTAGLRRFGYDINDLEDRDIKDLIIMEHSDWSKDRMRSAFCILQFSCNQNGMILQWETDAIKNSYRCVLSVQKQIMGDSYGSKKAHARNLAATDALFKLYETQDVIRISPRIDDEKNWISWDTITAMAEKLRNENVGEEPIVKNDEFGNPLPDAFLMTVLKGKIDEFLAQKVQDELIFGPGISLTEGREVRSYALSHKLKCDTMQYQGQPYLLIYEKLGWKKLVEVLKGRDRPYGKFILVNREDLPTYEDVRNNILKELPKIEVEFTRKVTESPDGEVNKDIEPKEEEDVKMDST